MRFRSKAEISFASWLIKEGINYEYEKHKLKYIPDPKIYLPDFYLPKYNFLLRLKVSLIRRIERNIFLLKNNIRKLILEFYLLMQTIRFTKVVKQLMVRGALNIIYYGVKKGFQENG